MGNHDEELRIELARTDATIEQVVRFAGQGISPGVARQLDRHARSLRALLGEDHGGAAQDTIEAARRALEAADPAAPLLMLAMAREQLSRHVRRRLAQGRPARPAAPARPELPPGRPAAAAGGLESPALRRQWRPRPRSRLPPCPTSR